MRGGVIALDFHHGMERQCLCDELAGSVVNCHKKVFTQFVRQRAETDRDRRLTRHDVRSINTIINTAVNLYILQ